MALKLILVRHAKSSWDDEGLADIERPLNKRGRRDAPVMGNWLRSRLMRDKVKRIVQLVSTAERARATCDLIDDALSQEVDGKQMKMVRADLDALYAASRDTTTELIRQRDETDCLMLVGHNPCIHELYESITGKSLKKYPTCAMAIIDFDIDDWHQLSASSVAHTELMTPKKLRSLA